MRDPVILIADGHSYERKAIEDWLQQSNRSPLTNEEIIATTINSKSNSVVLIDNYSLKSAIENLMNQSN